MGERFLPDELADASPGEALVYVSVREHGPIGTDEIAAETFLSAATVRAALRDFKYRDLLRSLPSPEDGRRRLWTLAEQDHRASAAGVGGSGSAG